jgi:hypothetical protein
LNVPEVEVFKWSRRARVLPGRLGRRIDWRRTIRNFGDELGPVVVRAILDRRGLDPAAAGR